ncbi:aryl-alcohol dehydrogenase-like predicted oxidoreductase [Motilibacter rhizosphaerae]|uniref:Aryl-alcohol dehydrogenase-like predicted oxidoreductase n=1 Tax=Motilibacter rhizosphaerae TaxID=598652 RepID=A0A4Q7NX20_9ACTN|nr:aldo/keto reductase [Motilibacter rhizosphaerae]RZS90952.1 aryl-alcohol dehydrogenase-like predicted oxidoreductase [Motilibacter rhizosphaerae]
MANIPGTDLEVGALVLGGNVFGWSADEQQSHAVLDAFVAAGGRFVDTADAYSRWAPGHVGGESETVIGTWLAKRGRRDDVVIATKVAKLDTRRGLSAANVRAAAEDSLRRLQTDHIDVYYAHEDDQSVPLEETLGAFDELVRAGKVRVVAASNYSAPRLAEALRTSEEHGLARYAAVQDHYNLVERDGYEGAYADLVAREGLASFPYFGLAAGFLTGKYRDGQASGARAGNVARYLEDPRTPGLYAALDAVADAHGTTVPAVALAWLRAQPTVTAPIASARTPEQLADILPALTLELKEDETAALRAAW